MSERKMHRDFDGPPKTLEEVGRRLDYLRSEGELKGVHGPATVGEAAALVGASTDAVHDSRRFYTAHREGHSFS